MTNKEAKAILIETLGEKEFNKDYARYDSFGWSRKMILSYMLEMNNKRTFEDAMRDYMLASA